MRLFRVRYTSLKNSRKVFRIPFTSVNIGWPEISLNSSPNSSEIFILPSESNKSASESADLDGFVQFSQACRLMMLGSGSEARIIFYISLKSIKDLSFCIEVVFIKRILRVKNNNLPIKINAKRNTIIKQTEQWIKSDKGSVRKILRFSFIVGVSCHLLF